VLPALDLAVGGCTRYQTNHPLRWHLPSEASRQPYNAITSRDGIGGGTVTEGLKNCAHFSMGAKLALP